MSDEPVVLTVVASELEANEICGLLRTAEIDCFYRQTNFGVGAGLGGSAAGPQEILVRPGDVNRARELLGEDDAG